ncbi:helix-turn-helix domain-containing protein [Streptantibioticus silvisoli]|uniref:Helix-turn-helix domain-containing protein n=1 Tax=Streptantibioticus silvisoli TaxID=2705255 RepID=A0ABT6W6A4_9ACTN|nr:helix-turn-helix domain-containing protein [Streptantibioticus silvisoli]MDI5965824.1 helix-turn-helix domain-containing protein [Streptantibioticus silvisoli]
MSLTSPPLPETVVLDTTLLERLVVALESIARSSTVAEADPEIRCYTPAQAAELLGVSENWVEDRMNEKTIPFTFIGKFRRMRRKHIAAVAEHREIDPTRQGHRPRSIAA